MTWQPLNLAAPEFAEPSEPPALCGLIYKGRRHLVSGVPEANKTMFSLIVGIELIRDGGTFALIDFESGPHATRLMLAELGATIEEIGTVFYVEPESEPTQDDIDALIDEGVSLAVIDASAGAYGTSALDDNKRGDAEIFGLTWVDPLWRAGIATLLVDHVTKNSDGRGKFAIGSERKAGRTDVHLGLEPIKQLSRGGSGLVRVATHKDRPGWLQRPHAAKLELRSDTETHAIAWQFSPDSEQVGDAWQPTVLMERVSRFLEVQAEPVSMKTVEDNVQGKSRDWIRKAVTALLATSARNGALEVREC